MKEHVRMPDEQHQTTPATGWALGRLWITEGVTPGVMYVIAEPVGLKPATPFAQVTAVSGMVERPDRGTLAQAHSARIRVTGWTSTNRSGEFFVGSIQVDWIPRKWLYKRVRASLYPSPNVPTLDVLQVCRIAQVWAARPRESNTAQFEIVGHLLRAERSVQRVRVGVFPQTRGIPSFYLDVRTTSEAIKGCDPAWTGVRMTGTLLGRLLLAEDIQPV